MTDWTCTECGRPLVAGFECDDVCEECQGG